AGRLWPVVEDVSQVSIAFCATYFVSGHAVSQIDVRSDVFLGDRLPETGPSRAGFKLCIGGKQSVAAAYTTVESVFVIVPVFTSEGAFRTRMASHGILFRRQLGLPLRVRLHNFFHFDFS